MLRSCGQYLPIQRCLCLCKLWRSPWTPSKHGQSSFAISWLRHASLWGTSKSKATEWNTAVSEAERIVGYPTSFMSLRCLLSDELSNVAMQMRKLVGSKHPLLNTARRFVYDGSHSMQTRGLVVLLVSKAAGPGCQPQDTDPVVESMVGGIYPRQRLLAEITEMIHTAYLVHKGTVNLSKVEPVESMNDMEFGNKMAVLSGDFLLANASQGLAELYSTKVVDLIATALGDMMAAEFTGFTDEDGSPVLPPDGATMQDWQQQTTLASGSLLAKSCQSAMILANHTEDIQQQAHQFGKYTAYAHQLREDLQPFSNPSENETPVSLTSAPVLLHLADSNSGSLLQQIIDSSAINHKQLYDVVSQGPGVQQAREMCNNYGHKALEALSGFQLSEARNAVENMVRAIIKV